VAYLLAFLWALPSGIFWFFNAELMLVTQVATTDAWPWLLATLVTVGQFIGYAGLFLFANAFLARVAFVRRAVAKVRIRRAGWATYIMFGTGGLMGVPPLLALFALYGSAQVGRLQWLILAAMPPRFLWYLGWATAPELLREHFGWFSNV